MHIFYQNWGKYSKYFVLKDLVTLAQVCEGAELSTFWSSVLLHTTEKVCFCHLSSLSDSYQETESAFHPTFFPWLQGEKTYKGESHFGKTLLGFDLKKFRIIHFIWDSPSFHFLFPSTHEVHILPSLKVKL